MSKNGITIAIVVGCLVALLVASHLGPGTGGDTPAPKPPTPTPAVICERWQDTLAGQIGKSIKLADELSGVLVEMYHDGFITDAELRAVNDALPDLTLKNRALTDDDASKIRGVK